MTFVYKNDFRLSELTPFQDSNSDVRVRTHRDRPLRRVPSWCSVLYPSDLWNILYRANLKNTSSEFLYGLPLFLLLRLLSEVRFAQVFLIERGDDQSLIFETLRIGPSADDVIRDASLVLDATTKSF